LNSAQKTFGFINSSIHSKKQSFFDNLRFVKKPSVYQKKPQRRSEGSAAAGPAKQGR
jgi:hypothetical protein